MQKYHGWYNYSRLHISNLIDQIKADFVDEEELLRHKTRKKKPFSARKRRESYVFEGKEAYSSPEFSPSALITWRIWMLIALFAPAPSRRRRKSTRSRLS